MAPLKTAALSGLLVSRKAADTPQPEHPGLEEAQTPRSVRVPSRVLDTIPNAVQGTGQDEADNARSVYYKALTLKVDKDRFTKLKNLGVQKDLRSQALMTEALDLLFAKHHI